MDSEHTDRAFEAALARGLRRNTGSGAPCPEPELIAAYADGTLDGLERSSWEGHVAGCDRCQAHLAALARTAPVEAVSAKPLGSRLGWLFDRHWLAAASSVAVVVVAVVAVVAVWVADPDPLPGADRPTVRVARADRVANQAPPARTPADLDQQEAPAAAVAPTAGPQPQLEALGEPDVAPRENAFAESIETAAEADALSALDQQRFERGAGALSRAQPAPVPVAERRVRNTSPAPATPAVAVRAQALSDETFTLVDSPARGVLWRVASSGAIEHSRDGASTWTVQLAEPGSVLTAGSAPSDVVCWLVGRAGAVFRTSDGTTWVRLPAPTPDDLVGIEAEDARTAIVTTAGGVSFRTVDGGQTWATPVDRSPR